MNKLYLFWFLLQRIQGKERLWTITDLYHFYLPELIPCLGYVDSGIPFVIKNNRGMLRLHKIRVKIL